MKPKILIVDDDKDIVLLFNQMFKNELKEEIFEFVFKFSAVEINEYLLSFSEESISLIILDIVMPDKSGIELLKEIKRGTNIPVFIFTAFDNESSRKDADFFNADKYFVKPIDFNELRKDILKIILDNKN